MTHTKDMTVAQKKINTMVSMCTCTYACIYKTSTVERVRTFFLNDKYICILQETELDQKKADRHSLLKACKVQAPYIYLHAYMYNGHMFMYSCTVISYVSTCAYSDGGDQYPNGKREYG